MGELLEHLANGTRNHEQTGDDVLTVKETSDSEFQIELTRASGEKQIFAHVYDRPAGSLEIKFTEPEKNKHHGTWNIKVLQNPLRLQCWEAVNDPYVSMVASMTE